MHEDHDGVAMSHWLCRPTPGTISRTTSAVSGFAGSHGVPESVLRRMTGGVTEALAGVFDAENDEAGAGEDTVVDAATDGLCLTVRLRGPGRWPADRTLARLSVLAARVELGRGERTDSMTVLLEFPSSGAVEGGGPGPHTAGQAIAGAPRRGSHPPSGPRRLEELNLMVRRARSRPTRR